MPRSAAHVTSRAERAGRTGCVVAELRGELDIASAPVLREELLGLLRPGVSRLVIDLSSVTYADASGIAVLVGTGRRAKLLGGWLRLASPAAEVAKVLSATGLNRHLAIFGTVEDAITGRDAFFQQESASELASNVLPGQRPECYLPATG